MSRQPKHIPMRMCVICRDKYPKRQMRRFVATADGVIYDSTGKREGRGAYVCDSPACQQQVATTNRLSRALGVSLSNADKDHIRQVTS